MKPLPDDPKKALQSLLRTLFGRDLPLERETALFIFVSALDVFMTYVLLRHSAEGRTVHIFTESNAVARYFLNHWGIKGLVMFKFAMVAIVTVLAQLIAMRRLDTARRLLNVATLLVCAVVIYSLVLLVRGLG
ncbi:MAG: hypothetical protein GXP27_04410 [Planctomycetes bacterium]|nr:hypothetical protein [Planctomycetota bacterium]